MQLLQYNVHIILFINTVCPMRLKLWVLPSPRISKMPYLEHGLFLITVLCAMQENTQAVTVTLKRTNRHVKRHGMFTTEQHKWLTVCRADDHDIHQWQQHLQLCHAASTAFTLHSFNQLNAVIKPRCDVQNKINNCAKMLANKAGVLNICKYFKLQYE